MENRQKYDRIFSETFGLSEAQLGDSLTYQSIPEWDSLGHMALIAALEDEFKIEMDIDDIIDFASYSVGLGIIKKYLADF